MKKDEQSNEIRLALVGNGHGGSHDVTLTRAA